MGAPPKFETFNKFWGWVPEHGVLRGLPSSKWRTKIFERLGQKNSDPFFSHFDPRAPSENGPIFDFLKNFHERSREQNIRGRRAHKLS